MFHVPFKYVQMTHQCLSCQYCIFISIGSIGWLWFTHYFRCLADFLAPSILVRKWFKNVKKKKRIEGWELVVLFFFWWELLVIMVINFSAIEKSSPFGKRDFFHVCFWNKLMFSSLRVKSYYTVSHFLIEEKNSTIFYKSRTILQFLIKHFSQDAN